MPYVTNSLNFDPIYKGEQGIDMALGRYTQLKRLGLADQEMKLRQDRDAREAQGLAEEQRLANLRSTAMQEAMQPQANPSYQPLGNNNAGDLASFASGDLTGPVMAEQPKTIHPSAFRIQYNYGQALAAKGDPKGMETMQQYEEGFMKHVVALMIADQQAGVDLYN